ncbi:MAG: hypothetical protein GY909_03030 [Oligoflexia bacterium]|nr:hypothetical protein [Oligoflexia bacterium]
MKKIFLIILFTPLIAFAQVGDVNINEDDLNIGGDIFNDFNEDLDSTQMMEDERFFRYGRFFSLQLSLGLTSFDGNRGKAYDDDPPSYGIGINYFMDFQTTFGMGMEFSKHHFFVDETVNGFRDQAPGLVDVNIIRVYFSTRYYIDTSDLGTAITYANPYLTLRLEYWYLTNKFRDQEGRVPNDSGGGLGLGLGGGLEFPVKIKESYIGLELLYHSVAFHDKYTQKYRAITDNGFGFEDLTGNVYTTMVSYVINW